MPNAVDPVPVRSFEVDRLRVRVYADRGAMGLAAARHLARALREASVGTDAGGVGTGTGGAGIGMVFASAPSQVEALAALTRERDVPWPLVTAFHLDEYVGLDDTHPRSFARFLREHVVEKVPLAAVHYLSTRDADLEAAALRYGERLRRVGLAVGCIGVGENGHIAFNEPNDTDFVDPRAVRVIELDLRSRQQQVNEGLFASVDEVPTHALTLTVPAILAARTLACVVPGENKAAAVARMLTGPIAPDSPASALRAHPAATLFLDREAAALIGR
jgi:glucosamine-6-phosphate deaminase